MHLTAECLGARRLARAACEDPQRRNFEELRRAEQNGTTFVVCSRGTALSGARRVPVPALTHQRASANSHHADGCMSVRPHHNCGAKVGNESDPYLIF